MASSNIYVGLEIGTVYAALGSRVDDGEFDAGLDHPRSDERESPDRDDGADGGSDDDGCQDSSLHGLLSGVAAGGHDRRLCAGAAYPGGSRGSGWSGSGSAALRAAALFSAHRTHHSTTATGTAK